MSLFMLQFTYTPESIAAQITNPQNRIHTIGHQLCEAAGGKLAGGWYTPGGQYDALLIADLPNTESIAALSLAVSAGGAIQPNPRITPLLTGEQGVAALKQAQIIAKSYKPAL